MSEAQPLPAAAAAESDAPKRRINLALQGGGAHGAFTWGVLDALLEDGRIEFEGISGTSAGAMNAAVMAHGFAQAFARNQRGRLAAQSARDALRAFWTQVGAVGSMAAAGMAVPGVQLLMSAMARVMSPYQANPLDINPLRSLLEQQVDFEAIARQRTLKLFIGATNVRTGRAEIFSGKRVTVDALMASACLPQLFKAVEIDGEAYWDGGYTGNPPLYPLTYGTVSSDVLIVQINPIVREDVPDRVADIQDRVNQITFNAPLIAETRAIAFVRKLMEQGRLDTALYRSLFLHRIDGGEALLALNPSSKLNATSGLVEHLFVEGRLAGQTWLLQHFDDLGVRDSLVIPKVHL
ncbi:patatin [Comamonas serinivorans]|uniref:Patatin n=1 Tax=Comamonas serinivorans TaxID=1082851 RepID=A0A1Y0EKN0_9BURK|nr:patatin-like phospholipase family protein [Comamonas serinivorans]ARU04147.1 patatin [Comamonas serinivorans]